VTKQIQRVEAGAECGLGKRVYKHGAPDIKKTRKEGSRWGDVNSLEKDHLKTKKQ